MTIMNTWKFYLLPIILSVCVLEVRGAYDSPRGNPRDTPRDTPRLRRTVTVAPQNVRVRKNPKIKASDVNFDINTTKINRGMEPTIERLANEMAILVNNLYKRRELDEVNVRSLVRIRFYLAAVYRETRNQKLKARILEAVREINEELRHRLDFEERYKAGLIKIPARTSPMARSVGTQTENIGIVPRQSLSYSRPTPPLVEYGPQPQTRQPSELRAGSISKLRGAADRARERVSARKQSVAPSIPPQSTEKLVALIQQGKIDKRQLTREDQARLEAYSQNLPVPVSSVRPQANPVPPISLIPRAELPARSRALLDFVESGKLNPNQLSPKDRAMVNAYLGGNAPALSQQAAGPSRLTRGSGVFQSQQPEPRPQQRPSQQKPVGSPASVTSPDFTQSVIANRGRRLQALLDKKYIDSDQLGEEDKKILEEYRASPEYLKRLPPPPPEMLAQPFETTTTAENIPPPPPPPS
ncbi:MAG: hypothetical protein A2977_00630 [Alphaproteobacteria bacterium RIFCSPLOWO2_01_FULL_45_8]|nr:MAG: hypothetical protein A3K20_00680 [Alphaproteobacteria bacterium GWA1_45_9]OFW96174.1 MAG: hypothetical protein A2977_00630 [Alphaproteobacteria bacterium RIFCSPLOWO2_01_FULL_45_8]HCI48433.1 hypothetical protein [Holosporales bacterium]